MSTNQILTGIGLIFALAVGSQVVAMKLRIPTLIILLPVGFTAGALTSDVNPSRLLGPAFQPVVSLAVAVILYDAGLGLDPAKLRGHARKVVIRLIVLGIVFSFTLTAIIALTLLGMSTGAATMLGVILVVSGPTVVGPLLAFVRPAERVQHILAWEGSLMDPIGGILGAAVFHGVSASASGTSGVRVLDFLESLGVGVAGAIVAIALLWLLLVKLDLPQAFGTSAQLAVVVAVAAACDAVRTDSGLIAAIVAGVAVSNMRGFNIPQRRAGEEAFVQLIIALLFVSIAATITPASLKGLILPTLGLVAVLVLVARPLAAAASTWRTDLTAGERGFIGWMAPRGIVAAATATTFAASLVSKGVGGASKILPVTFLVIVATVTIYGLTAMPVARRLGVLEKLRTRPLLVGSQPWVIDLGRALRGAGLDALMWAGYEDQRRQIREANLPLAEGQLIALASGQTSELEGITDVYLLTDEDDYNALASIVLRTTRGEAGPSIYRLAPADRAQVTPRVAREMLFGGGLDTSTLKHKYSEGARIDSRSGDGSAQVGGDLLFVIDAEGLLHPATEAAKLVPKQGDELVLLGPSRRS